MKEKKTAGGEKKKSVCLHRGKFRGGKEEGEKLQTGKKKKAKADQSPPEGEGIRVNSREKGT